MSRKSSRDWLQRQSRDPYVKRAHRDGGRSRAVYKIEEIDQRDRLLRPGMTVIDLGAAPGGFAQYAVSRVIPRGRVLAIDLLTIAPLPGVDIIQGDATDPGVLGLVVAWLADRKADLVMSDMAPNISGVRDSDDAKSEYLADVAVEFAAQNLRTGGTLILKAFHGGGFADLKRRLEANYESVAVRKPKASRGESPEVYLVARGLQQNA